MVKDIVFALGAFSNASGWLVNELSDEIDHQKSHISSLEDQVKQHELTIRSLL